MAPESPVTGRLEKEAFNPEEEIYNAAQLPKGEKAPAIKDLKEKLIAQEHAWSACRVRIENALLANPDMPKRGILALISESPFPNGIPEGQMEIAEDAVDRYIQIRRNVVAYRNEHPDDRELIRSLTGIALPADASIDITVGPVSIDIVTDPLTATRIYENSPDTQDIFKYGGFATGSGGKKSIRYSVIRNDVGQEKKTIIHERQHQINNIFQEIFDDQFDAFFIDQAYEQYVDESDPAKKREFITEYFRAEIYNALNRAKDEILAYGREKRSLPDVAKLLKQKDGEAYDYLRHLREHKENDPVWKESVRNILVKEYDRDIDRSVLAFGTLSLEYGRERAIALLTPHHALTWPKIVTRIMQQEKGKESLSFDQIQEAKKREEVRNRLTRRALFGVDAGIVSGIGAEVISNEARKTHEDLRNVAEVETENAFYRVEFGTDFLGANPEVLRGMDAVIIEMPDVENEIQAENRVSSALADREESKSRGMANRFLASWYGKDGTSIPPGYRALMERALEENIPIYFADSVGVDPTQGDGQDLATVGEFVAGAALTAWAGKDLSTRRPSRRSILSGIAKLFGGAYLSGPIVETDLAALDPFEPNVHSIVTKSERMLKKVDLKTHPEMYTKYIDARDTLIAQKAETLGGWLSHKLKRKPNIAIAIGKNHMGLLDELNSTPDKRIKKLKRVFEGDTIPQSHIEKVIRNEEGYVEGKKFTDESIKALDPESSGEG